MMLSILLACAPNVALTPTTPLLTPLVDPLPVAQDAEEANPHQLIIDYFYPKNMKPRDLQGTIRQLGNDGSMQHKTWRGEDNFVYSDPIFLEYGDGLLVKDTRVEMPNTLMLLNELDANFREEERRRPEAEPTQLFQYVVTHVGIDSVRMALNNLFMGGQARAGGGGLAPPKFSFVEEKNLVIFKGTAAQNQEAKDILLSLDVPMPRVMLSCYLISGSSAEGGDPRVPADLAKDLSSLVPYTGFQLLSSAILPSDTTGQIELTVQLEGGKGGFDLRMDPVAYDKSTGTLALGSVEFELDLIKDKTRERKAFQTSTSLRQGEYTVLGAVGADPVFVVMKLSAAR